MPLLDRSGPPEGTGPQTGRRRGIEGNAQEAPTSGVDIDAVESERLQSLAGALGLHGDFVDDVKMRGEDAIIDRVEETDATGALAKMMRVIQQFGTWMEERMARGRPPEAQEVKKAISHLARKVNADPNETYQLVMSVMEQTSTIMQGLGGGNANATST